MNFVKLLFAKLTNLKRKQMDEERNSKLLVPNIYDMKTEIDMLKLQLNKKIGGMARPGWKVIQDKGGETMWYKQDKVSYVSEIYQGGIGWEFNAVIGGAKIAISRDSRDKLDKIKMSLLDVERVDDYDLETQSEMFPRNN